MTQCLTAMSMSVSASLSLLLHSWTPRSFLALGLGGGHQQQPLPLVFAFLLSFSKRRPMQLIYLKDTAAQELPKRLRISISLERERSTFQRTEELVFQNSPTPKWQIGVRSIQRMLPTDAFSLRSVYRIEMKTPIVHNIIMYCSIEKAMNAVLTFRIGKLLEVIKLDHTQAR